MELTSKIAAAAIGLSAMAPSALAATATTNLTITATVADTCIVAATTVAFGSLSGATDTDEATAGNISLSCTSNKTGVTVALGGGDNALGGQRRMDDGGSNYVPYNLFSDAAHNNDVAINGNIFSGNVTAAVPQSIDVYGQVPAGSYAAGAYTDTVVITVTYP